MLTAILASLAIGAIVGCIYGSINAHNNARYVVDKWQHKLLSLEKTARTLEERHCIASAMDALFEVYREI